MKDLCVIVPTYNREDSIEYYLQTQLKNFCDNGIDVWIYDSSDGQETNRCVEKYQQKGFSNLFYKYCSAEDNIYGSWKTFYALLECATTYKYIWLSGDTTIIQINNIIKQLKDCLKEEYDIIHIYQSKDVDKSQAYSDCCEIFRLFWWSMTHWCSVIFSSKCISGMEEIMKKNLEINNGFFIVTSVFEYMASREIHFYYIKDSLYIVSPYRLKSTAHLKKDILRSWAKVQSESIDSLPDIYDKYKNVTKKSTDRNIRLFSFFGVVILRADGNITISQIKEYGKYIKTVTETPLSWFYIWSLVPRKMAQIVIRIVWWANKIEQKIVTFYYKR